MREATARSLPTPLPPNARDNTRIDPEVFRRAIIDRLMYSCAKDRRDATPGDFYRAMSYAVRDRLVQRWLATRRTHETQDVKRVHYLSSEFLTGRSLGLALVNLGLFDVAQEIGAQVGFDLGEVLDSESDAGLGNGGLGRLAACFMDSLATLDLPATGYGIRYEYGIFEQRIENGQQVETRDNWLQNGNPWELPRHDLQQTVRMYGRTEFHRDPYGNVVIEWLDTRPMIGVPYDSFIVGHETNTVNTLRLWSARATRDFDLHHFNHGDYRRAVEEKVEVENISKVLYPNDHTEEGKELRLKQQYFFVACSIADVVADFKRRHSDFRLFPERAAIQLNDTHPAIAVAELMRVLLDDENLPWDLAWDITQRTIAYTNHTLLPEALERWPVTMFERVLPRHLLIIYEINQRFLRQVSTRWPNDLARLARMSLIEEGHVKQIRMAHLATLGSHSINGVAQLHSDLVKSDLLPDFYGMFPERFNNKTNGVTPRRWLLYANPALSRLLAERLGPRFMDHDLQAVRSFVRFADDTPTLDELAEIKRDNKHALAQTLVQLTGVKIDPEAMLICQIKRFHEYKRQLLACLEILAHYLRIKDAPQADFTPRTYLFSGKAAAGYHMAKLHIRLIHDIANVINQDPSMKDKLRIVFAPNYGVSLAQVIIPAADVSLQISQAGKEASGTSNMKFAMNGALTVGTLDGANVEIRDAVGHENFFLFGHTVDQVHALYKSGYSPRHFIQQSPELTRVVDLLESDFLALGDVQRYAGIAYHLRHSDYYMCCADFDDYQRRMTDASEVFRTPRSWHRHALYNIAGASKFTSDATIREYANEIWNLSPVQADMSLVEQDK